VYIARQPILDREQQVAGYELLFRTGGGPIRDGVFATASVAAKTFADPAFADALGPHRGFINVDAPFLQGDLVEFLPPRRTVLELLETTRFTPEVVARCRELKAQGYMLASDDYAGDRAAIAPALALLDIVKVDLPRLDGREPAAIARELPGKTLLAEKVETQADYLRFRDAGYALFQGYYFARPETVGKAAPDPGRFAALRLLALALDDQAEDSAIEEEIKREPGLGIGVLRLVNSAAAGLSRPVSSLREALVFLGRRQLRLWLQLLVYLGTKGGDPARQPLLQLAAVRGKVMEILARRMGRASERAFLAGLISLFHVAVGVPIGELMQRLHLDDELAAALTARSGEIGALLSLAEAMERADDAAVAQGLEPFPALAPEDLLAATETALRWAGGIGAPG
jgi:EAL and modified HD-GYP domain-containing signal transduction protein